MSSIEVTTQTQNVVVNLGSPRIIVDPLTSEVTVAQAQSSVGVINAGPSGPAGPPGEAADTGLILDEVDVRIGTHNQSTPVHEMATSGRDFVALFQNGLI